MKPSVAVSDFGGRRYHRFVLFNFLLSLAARHIHSVLVFVTGNKFIAGVVVTDINIHSRIFLRIFKKIQNGPNGILAGPGDNDL
jgi:hypothetical protein